MSGQEASTDTGFGASHRAGGPSRKTLSSRTMILTGIVVLIFVGVHLKSFKYGPHYSTEVDGVVMRDLHRLVVQKFSRVEYVAGYVVAMVFLGFHLRHGFWSAFQSLGVHHPRFTPVIYGTGVVLAILLAAGFIVLPVWIFFCGGGS